MYTVTLYVLFTVLLRRRRMFYNIYTHYNYKST